MTKLINEYSKAAIALEMRSKELAALIKQETDVYKLHSLERRKYTLDCERYEILRDIKDMLEHLPEEEALKWQEQSA